MHGVHESSVPPLYCFVMVPESGLPAPPHPTAPLCSRPRCVSAAARSILINAACQLVIFLYLLDSETSAVVLFSSGIGCAIEFWKVWGQCVEACIALHCV